MRMRQTFRSAVLSAVILTLVGCIGPFGPQEERTFRYDGSVTRADGSPVAGVQVEITSGTEVLRPGSPPPPPEAEPCSGTIDGIVERASTDARGKYLVQARRRSDPGGPCVRVRATPPVGSGLAEAVVTGDGSLFNQPDSNEDLLHRRVDVVLQPAR